jgi:beta-galactosidase
VAGWTLATALGWRAPGAALARATLPAGRSLPADAKPAGRVAPARPLPGAAPRLPATEPNRLSLDAGWLFHEGDIPFPEPTDHNATYLSVKAGNAGGAAALDFDARTSPSRCRMTGPAPSGSMPQPMSPKAIARAASAGIAA